ncbi:type II secretion system protein GspL [Xylophilus sp. GW821-FHT01B05]
MSTLIVSLPAHAGAAELPYVLTGDGHTALRHGSAAPALLPSPGRAGEVVAVVPVRALSWQRVELPRGVRANGPAPRVRAVLEGLLEERLLDDPQSLHFALAPGAHAGTPAWVAVCDRAWLHGALQALEAAGRPASRIVPEFAPEATQPVLHALGTPEDPLLVALGRSADDAMLALPLSAASLALTTPPPEADAAPLPILAEPAVAALAEQLAGRPVQLHTSTARWLAAARSPWDLAQFDLASSGRRRVTKRAGALLGELLRAPQWRAARWGTGLLVAAQLVGLNAWAWKERSALDTRQASLNAVLTQTFPSVRVVVDAPIQMERELALLRQATGTASGGFEALLAAIGTALPADHSPRGLEFAGDELRLRGLDLAAAESAAFTDRLRSLGIATRSDGEVLVLKAEVAR